MHIENEFNGASDKFLSFLSIWQALALKTKQYQFTVHENHSLGAQT